MDWTYCEYFDGEWHLAYMPARVALVCQLALGNKFRYLDESMIEE